MTSSTPHNHPDEYGALTPLAIREMADKARFGGFYYLLGLVGGVFSTTATGFSSPPIVFFLVAFCAPLALREMAFRLAQSDAESSLKKALRVIEVSYVTNAALWAAMTTYLLWSVQALDAGAATTIIAGAGFAAGGVTAIVPHYRLIRLYSALMLIPILTMPFLLDGNERWYLTSLYIVYFFFLLRLGRILCTSYRHAQERSYALQRYTEELEIARQQALAGSRAKSEFLANMSHEIRTPMNGVIGIAQLLENTPLDDQQKKFIKIIRDSGSTLLDIIDDILDFSKLEARKLALKVEPTDLRQLLLELESLFTLQLHDKSVQLFFRISPELPALLSIDPVRIRQVLYNLIGNAIKFTQAGEIIVQLDYSPDSDNAKRQGRIHVSVIDSGIGIAPEHQSLVFAQFEQLGNPNTTKGSGLGLSICKHLITMMQGDIGFRSEVGIGSHFWFEIPVVVASAPAPLKNLGIPAQKPVSLAGLSVLVVEDDAVNQIVIESQLRSFGCHVMIAASGEAAIKILRDMSFDLILMDYNLPGLDGYGTTLEARKLEIRKMETAQQQKRTPIIALTAHALNEVKQRCLEAGMDDYLTKPIIATELRHAIARWSDKTKFTDETRRDANGESPQPPP